MGSTLASAAFCDEAVCRTECANIARRRGCDTGAGRRKTGLDMPPGRLILTQVIARLLVILSLMLLVAAPASELAGSALAAPAAQLELVDEPVPLADDEVAAPHEAAPAAPPAWAAWPGACEDGPPAARPRTQIFRPPRSSLA